MEENMKKSRRSRRSEAEQRVLDLQNWVDAVETENRRWENLMDDFFQEVKEQLPRLREEIRGLADRISVAREGNAYPPRMV